MIDNSAATKYFNLGSTIRSQLPNDTLAKIQPIAQAIGITRVANVTGLDHLGVPVAICIRPNAKHLSVSQGKGSSWELAKISAMMESIEGYHAENPQPAQIQGSFLQLQETYPVVDPRTFNPWLFEMPELSDWQLDWTGASELISDQRVYIPHALICLDGTRLCKEYGFLNVNSNGLAAGNVLEEAICHGLYEVIERDCIVRWQGLTVMQEQETQIDLDTVNASVNQSLIQNFQQANLSVRVWDISSSLKIPAFICSITDHDLLRGLYQFEGSGAHLSKEIALSRALTEAAQSRLTLISGSRDDVFPSHYRKQTHVQNKSISNGQRDFAHCPSSELSPSFADHLHSILTVLQEQNFKQVFMVNHTRSEFNLPVVHVFVPGMQFNGHRF